MTITDFDNGVIIDTTDDREADLGFFIVLRDMYGERAIPEMGRMLFDLSGLPRKEAENERGTIRRMFDLR